MEYDNSREKEDESDATADDDTSNGPKPIARKMCGLSSSLRKRCDGRNVCEYEDGNISSSITEYYPERKRLSQASPTAPQQTPSQRSQPLCFAHCLFLSVLPWNQNSEVKHLRLAKIIYFSPRPLISLLDQQQRFSCLLPNFRGSRPQLPPALSVGSQLTAANAALKYCVGGQPLSPASSPIVVSTLTCSLGHEASALVANGVMSTLPAYRQTNLLSRRILAIGSLQLAVDAK